MYIVVKSPVKPDNFKVLFLTKSDKNGIICMTNQGNDVLNFVLLGLLILIIASI